MAPSLDQALRAQGLRVTAQRRLVLSAVEQLGHATPEQVVAHVAASGEDLSLSTAYRALELLEDLGLVSHTHLDHGAPTYQPAAAADHVHLVCRGCGDVGSAPHELVAAMAEEVRARSGFRTDVGHLALHGWCAACDGHGQGNEPAGEEPARRER